MIKIVCVFWAYLIGVAVLFKLALLMFWSAQLHAKHASRHSYWEIFRMFGAPFCAKSERDMDLELWRDFEPVQRKHFIWDGAIVAGGFVVLLGSIVINRLWS